MRSRIGWELWPGAGQWALITGVHIHGDDVLITIEDGTTFRARYADAIQCREPAPPEIGDPALVAPKPRSSLCVATSPWLASPRSRPVLT